jgi:hypothetical protein
MDRWKLVFVGVLIGVALFALFWYGPSLLRAWQTPNPALALGYDEKTRLWYMIRVDENGRVECSPR